MPSPKRTHMERLAIRERLPLTSTDDDLEVLRAVYGVLVLLAGDHAEERRSYLVGAARNLTRAMIILDETKRNGVPDSRVNLMEEHQWNEQAAGLPKTVREEADQARRSTGIDSTSSNRVRLVGALKWAWMVATGNDIPGRKTDAAGCHYGEFPDFIKRVLAIRCWYLNADELHRECLLLE